MPRIRLTASLKISMNPGYKAPPGRNDPCPCLSGKKFKKCCGARYSDYVSEQLKAAHKEFDRRSVPRQKA